jgi:DNA-binding response OmpR family regulator
MSGQIPPGQRSVLVVDDDPDIGLGLRDLLEHDGYRVYVAVRADECLAAATEAHFDAVLLDLGLPDHDGFYVLNALHAMEPRLPVIILTAFAATDKSAESLSRGAFAYVTKPYNRDELRAMLKRAIDSVKPFSE